MFAVNDDDESINLYSNRYGVIVNEQLYLIEFEDGDTLDLTFTFSTVDSSILQTEYIAEAGIYSVKFKLFNDEDCLDTELDIIVV